MSLIDDTAIFAAIVQHGGFSHAAKHLGLSNGSISRRMAELETRLGVTLLKRTTRQVHLTPEGELFWEHAKRIQQELDSALCLMQSYADKPKGNIRISAPTFFGNHYLMPILNKFMTNFENINIELILNDSYLDPIKEKIDLLIRITGFYEKSLKDSSLKTKLIYKKPITLYASSEYLIKKGMPQTPDDLFKHDIISYSREKNPNDKEVWSYHSKGKEFNISLKAKFTSNDVDTRVAACIAGHGIGRFTELINLIIKSNNLKPVLQNYDWGMVNIYAVYAQQTALPKRTRLVLDFIVANLKNLQENLLE